MCRQSWGETFAWHGGGVGEVFVVVSMLRAFSATAVAMLVASCSLDGGQPGRSPEASGAMQPASPSGGPGSAAAGPGPNSQAIEVAQGWAEDWCGWDWRHPQGAREVAARGWMTPVAAAQLVGTEAETWQSEVVAAHEQATCTGLTVQLSAGTRSPERVHVSITADRTVRSDRGVMTGTWAEDRRVVLVDGRWLVDELVLGG